MKKRLIGSLLMGALMVASTSVFVSCKDYDDDINNIVATKADKTALEQVKSDLTNSISTLKKDLEAKDAELAALIATKADASVVDAAVARVAALETRLTTAESTLSEINTILGGQLPNGKTYKDAIVDIYAQLETITAGLGQAMTSIETLKAGLADEETARKAAITNLQTQIDALDAYAKRLEQTEIADKAELLTKINDLKNDLQGKIDTINGTITDIQNKMNDMATEIDKVKADINVLTVLINTSLRSLVFVPEFYYFGIEATSVTGVYTKFLPADKLPAVDPDKSDDTWANATKHTCWPYDDLTDHEYIVENWVVRYHLNPSTADVTDAQLNVLQADREYVTKAVQDQPNTNIYVLKNEEGKQLYEKKDGDLHVTMGLLNPDIVRNIGHLEKDDAMSDAKHNVYHFVEDCATEDRHVTVFATEVTLKDKDTKTVTSDYAALRAGKTFANGYRLAHTKVGDPAVKAPLKGGDAAGSYTGVDNQTAGVNKQLGVPCGPCDGYSPAVHGPDHCHLFTSSWETVYDVTTQVKQLRDQPLVAALNEGSSTTTAQDVVFYNGTIDLTKLVEVHRIGEIGKAYDESLMSDENLKANNLEIQFELTGILMSGNATSESAHAAIKKDENGHYILRPQLPIMEYDEQGHNIGKAAAWETTAQSRTTIGRSPLVRVKLVDTKLNRILDYGFIRLVIIDEYQEVLQGYLTVPYDAQISADYTYYNYACEQNSIAGGTWTQNWGSLENDIYKHKSNPQLSQVEFESKYDSLLVSTAGLNTGDMLAAQPVVGGALQQYILKFNADGTPKKDANGNYVIDRPATEAEYLGNITVKTGTNIGDGTKTQVLTWAITAAQMKYWLITKHLSAQNSIQKKYKFKNDGYLASAKSGKEYRAVKYQVVDATDNTIRDIYVVLYTGDLKITPNNDRATAKAVFDTYKIEEYWYKENTQTTAKGKTPKTDEANLPYWREAHLNVPSPEDWQPTWQDGAKKPFEFLLASDFNKNNIPNWIMWESAEMLPTSHNGAPLDAYKPHFDEFFTVTDPTPKKDFDWSKHFGDWANWAAKTDPIGYTFEFHEKNEGAQFKGFSGTTYTLSLGSKKTLIADGTYKDLDNWALLATANGKTDTVAYLEYNKIYTSYAATNSVNNINIVLKKKPSLTGSNRTNSYAEDLLNYCKHDELDDNDLKALLGVRLHYDCAQIVPEGEIQVRFLRPINVLSEDKEVQDAANTTQEILIYDIIRLTDWRDQWNPQGGDENMVNKPRRTLVDGTPFNFKQDGNKWTVDYWYYYNIKEILVGYVAPFKNDGEPLNDIMTSNMNNNPSFKPLNQISNNVEFTYLAPTNIERTYDEDGNVLTQRASWIGDPHFYGSILYKNNRSTVDDFDVKVPITVIYEWGAIYNKEVTIKVRKTLNNTDSRKF